jgi:methyl-accepting chemotaxis protein
MAIAIYNNLNKPDNCAHYILSLLKEEMKTEELNRLLMEHIGRAIKLLADITTMVHQLDTSIASQTQSVEESSKKTEKMVGELKNTSQISLNKQSDIKELLENASLGQESMRETIQSVQGIAQSVDGIGSAIKIISAIAANTNLLSMNAAIEAAHAGDAGKGFAVVANEIRRLSENTRENSRNISQTLKNIIDGIAVTSKRSDETDNRITEMSREIDGFAQTMTILIGTFNQLASESTEIIAALDSLKNQSASVKTVYADIMNMTDSLRDAMVELGSLSKSNVS